MMRKWRHGLIALTLMLGACAEQSAPLGPVAAATLLRTGQPVLRCGDACLSAWQRAQPAAARLEAGGSWSELAGLVIGVGYRDDLTLYYLGRAAEQLGYRSAADSYYGQSVYLSRTVAACSRKSGVCGGVSLPAAAAARRAAIEHQFTARPPRRTRGIANDRDTAPSPAEQAHEDSFPPAPLPAVSAGTTSPAAIDWPPPPQTNNAGEARARDEPARPSRVDPGTADYIEPPAAR
jgi:hypothetical protein